MLNMKALQSAIIIGTVLQVAMVVIGHFSPMVAAYFATGGVGISAAAGVLYGRSAAGFGGAALGGGIAGGVCALIGIVISFALGDVEAMILAIGTFSSAVTGALGGLAGRLIPGTRTASA